MMSGGPWAFTKTEVARAVGAVRAAGLVVYKIEIYRTGKIVIVTEMPDYANDANSSEPNPWDKVLIHASDEKRPS
jgi:hypothetical protein